jgi:gamma-glutamyl-gamma-aminobutyrate hydrolase PuuD
LVPACVNRIGAHPYHTAQLKYVAAVADGARCTPLIVPALGAATDFEALLALADGVMLTGSPSNVHASLYGEEVLDPSLPQDAARDATTLPLIRAAIKRGIPLLAICRGFQEVNVALGGTLHQAVHAVAGMADHRENKEHPLDQQYAPSHRVLLDPGGRWRRYWTEPQRSWSTRCTDKASTSWRPASWPKRAPTTAWWKPTAWRTPKDSRWRYSGILSGAFPRTRTPSNYSEPLATPAAPTRPPDNNNERSKWQFAKTLPTPTWTCG